jgi:ribosomal protein L21E
MAKKQTPINEITFVRSLKATDANGKVESSFIAQPYCVGMYVAISIGSSLTQLNLPHKKFGKWVKGSIKLMEKNGLTVTTTESKLIDFLSETEIKDYIL